MSRDIPDDRRLTKAERKEQARQEREALQRRLASRRRRNRIGVGLVASGVAVAAFTFFVSPEEGGIPGPDGLLARASQAASSAGCTDVQTTPPFEPADQDRQHVGGGALGAPPLSAYATTPPASGPHADVTLPAGVYDTLSLEEFYRSIHSLEHGASIVWYDPTAPAERIAGVLDFYDRRLQDASVGQDRVIVAPYDFAGQGDGLLPEGQDLALVAWHRLRSCAELDLAVAYDFTSQYSFPTSSDRDYAGEAPEPGAAL
ncbi:MAG TPA: DUF3105 domain-containing protein [Actinomycetota bacterium]|nr:DUF3105 domain-containing protein [Actinomycetota bacterium]